MQDLILEMRNITKVFPGVKALDSVNIKVKKGEIHSLCGENGAGKSTLMKILSGVYPYGTYEGDIFFDEEKVEFHNIKASEHKGIAIIHQELALIKTLSIAENIFLGNEIAKFGIIDWDETYKQTTIALKRVGLDENPSTLIRDLSVGKQQLVEIASAIRKDVKLLILDEPTSALNEEDSQNLLKIILDLKNHGVTSIIISHKLNEIEQISDSLTILRDGKTVDYLDMINDEVTEDRIVKSMVGREITELYPERNASIGDIIFEVKNWYADHPTIERKILEDINIVVRAGEVVGIAGLMGSGRTELARSIFGKSYGRNIKGSLIIRGKEVVLNSVADAIANKIAYVTEDRKSLGLILINSIKNNVAIANLKRVSKNSILDENLEIQEVHKQVKALKVKFSDLLQETKNLSGGNQQKVVLSKWMFSEPDILILDEPTRGIDVGAKHEIYQIINHLAEQGKAVIVISSELLEVMGLSDRIYVMGKGKIKAELPIAEATQESIMRFIVSEKVVGGK
jgi:putative multiple sugar transport system ATP-binding protein